MYASRKPTLRQLATEVGILRANDPSAYHKEREELLGLLQGKFPGIEEMEEEAVRELLEAEKAKNARGKGKEEPAPAPARGRSRAAEPEAPKEEPARGRGRGRAAEPETPKEEPPKEESRGRRGRGEAPKEEPKEEPVPEGRGRGRGRGRAVESESEAPRESEVPVEKSSGGSGNDAILLLETLLKEVSGIATGLQALGDRLTKTETLVTSNTRDLETLGEKLDLLTGRIDEVHVGVESLYLEDFDKKDQSLADVLTRVVGGSKG